MARTRTAYPTLLGGAIDTYAALQGIDQRAKAGERAEQRFGLEMATAEHALESSKEEQRRQRLMREGRYLDYALQNDVEVDPKRLTSFMEAAEIDTTQFVTPEYGEALQTLNSYASSPGSVEKEKVIEAANIVYANRLNRNTGEAVPDGRVQGKGATVKGKRVADFYAGPNGKELVFELEVEAAGEGGDPEKYRAPMTKGRSASDDDDEVLRVPIESLVKNLRSQTALRQMMRNPKLGKALEAAVVRFGGEPIGSGGEGVMEVKQGDEILTYRVGENGQPTGDPIARAPRWQAEKAGGQWGTMKVNRDGKEEAWITYNGLPVRQFSESPQWKPEDGPPPGTDVAELNLMERMTRNFWGTLNENGQIILPEGSQQNYAETFMRAQQLRQRGLDVGQAFQTAALSISGQLTEEEAQRKAEIEAAEKYGISLSGAERTERKKFVKDRTNELLQESKTAKHRYEKLMAQSPAGAAQGGGAQPTGGTGTGDRPAGGARGAPAEVQLTGEVVGQTPDGRPLIRNNQGGVSSELSITVEDERLNDGKPTNIPSIYGGKIVTPEEAIERVVAAGGKDPETGRKLPGHKSIEAAEKAARRRSQRIEGASSAIEQQELVKQGAQAIQKGAPRAAVIQRLRDMGVSDDYIRQLMTPADVAGR